MELTKMFSHPNAVNFTAEQMERMRAMYERDGKGSVEIGRVYGLAASSVVKRLRKMGVTIRKGGTRNRFSDEVCLRIAREKGEGYTIEFLAARYECSTRKICYVLARARKIAMSQQARQ